MMGTSEPSPPQKPESFDRIALDLQALREEAGSVSYADLVRRIADLRLERGINPAAAIPARSTVYSAFQTGRSRMDLDLVRDIVIALGEDQSDADAWVQRCRAARRAKATTVRPEPSVLRQPEVRRISLSFVVLFLVGCTAVNLLGLYVTGVFRLSVYLDMVGTAIAAIVLGPWHGVAVAIASNGFGFLTGDPATIPFTPVNIVGALVWGYGIRRFRMGAGIARFVSLNLVVALACSLVAAPIVVAAFHGGEGHASEQAVLSLEAMQLPFAAAVFSANIVTSMVDKLLTGFIALVAFTLLHNRMGLPANHMPLVERLGALRIAEASSWARAVPQSL